mgnify:CR=1 FL=1
MSKDPKVGTGKNARKIQILTVLEQRAKFGGKPQQAKLAKAAKDSLRRKHGTQKKSKKS